MNFLWIALVLMCSAREFPMSPALMYRLTINSVVQARNARTPVYPDVYYLGPLDMAKCMQDNPYGIDGIYCYNLTVPLDRYDLMDKRRIKVAFMVHIAESQLSLPSSAHKVVFLPSGGPGTVTHSQVPATLSMMSNYQETYLGSDLVFVDQRGMGWSCGLSCWKSYLDEIYSPLDADEIDIARAANRFRTSCDAEIRSSVPQAATSDYCIIGSNANARTQRMELIPFMRTKYAATDFEDFRLAAGYGKVTLFAFSYGTIVCQVYAAMFPNRVASMILDSPFDTLTDISLSARREASGRRDLLARLAEICVADPGCVADACPLGVNCAAVTLAKFASVLNCSRGWPKTFTGYPYVDPNTATRIEVTAVLHSWMEGTLVGFITYPRHRAFVSKMLLRSAAGDNSELMRFAFGIISANPRDPDLPVELAMAMGIAQTSVYPMVTGEDYMWRWDTPPPPYLTVMQRQKQYMSAYGHDEMRDVLGISPISFSIFSAAYGNPWGPVYSDLYQNRSLTPVPGWHGNYPILIAHPSRDSNCPGQDAINLFEEYSTSGPTYMLTLDDGPHAISVLGQNDGFFDPGYSTILQVLDSAVGLGVFPNVTTTESSLQVLMSSYRRIVTSTSLDTILSSYEDEFITTPEFVMYYTIIAGCDADGFVYWGTMADSTHEEITFVSCSMFDGRYTVNGIATYDWATPQLFALGPNFHFDVAYVTDNSHGTTACYTYDHVSGSPPVQTLITCPTPSARSTQLDHRYRIARAMKNLVNV